MAPSRIQFLSVAKCVQRFPPPTLPTINVPGRIKNLRIIRQGRASEDEFFQRFGIIAISTIEIETLSQVRFTDIR